MLMVNRKNMPSGFTLIELLVVISIIALLLSIMMPALSTARERGRAIVEATQVRNLGMSFLLYANDNKQILPEVSRNWAYWYSWGNAGTQAGKSYACITSQVYDKIVPKYLADKEYDTFIRCPSVPLSLVWPNQVPKTKIITNTNYGSGTGAGPGDSCYLYRGYDIGYGPDNQFANGLGSSPLSLARSWRTASWVKGGRQWVLGEDSRYWFGNWISDTRTAEIKNGYHRGRGGIKWYSDNSTSFTKFSSKNFYEINNWLWTEN